MKDTTFWPNAEQTERVAKSYRPDAAKTNLEAFPISQLIYPLSDRTRRFPMPAGGLFSTASDTALFCRMLLNGGELNGRRYLSEAALRRTDQTANADSVNESYGLGFAVGSDWYGHGGARDQHGSPAQTGAGHRVDGAARRLSRRRRQAQGVFKNWAERFGK